MGGIRGLRLAGEQWNVWRRRLRRAPHFRQISYADIPAVHARQERERQSTKAGQADLAARAKF